MSNGSKLPTIYRLKLRRKHDSNLAGNEIFGVVIATAFSLCLTSMEAMAGAPRVSSVEVAGVPVLRRPLAATYHHS